MRRGVGEESRKGEEERRQMPLALGTALCVLFFSVSLERRRYAGEVDDR